MHTCGEDLRVRLQKEGDLRNMEEVVDVVIVVDVVEVAEVIVQAPESK